MTHSKRRIYRDFFKRPMDFVLALVTIILFFPIFLVVSLLVRTKLGSPILFKQLRPGLDGKIFTIYKFRTMTDEKDGDGLLLHDDMRLTKLGKVLRSTSLDELPQLFNILKGDMSIIGPRPLLERHLVYFTHTEKRRQCVRPGLSGLAQVNGRNNLQWDRRLAKDVTYVDNITFLGDVKIIYQTVLKIIKREDVTVSQQAIPMDFDVERKSHLVNWSTNNRGFSNRFSHGLESLIEENRNSVNDNKDHSLVLYRKKALENLEKKHRRAS